MDKAWEAIGGGPSDLVFPEDWVGRWDVTSMLVKIETPMGVDILPDSFVRVRASPSTAAAVRACGVDELAGGVYYATSRACGREWSM